MRKILTPVLLAFATCALAQHTLTGRVLSGETGRPLAGAAVTIPGYSHVVLTDASGNFSASVPDNSFTLTITAKGHETASVEVSLPLGKALTITLGPNVQTIDEVTISTGYQRIPKERATGSFSTVSSRLLNQQLSTNILEKLAGAANGLMLDKGTRQTEARLTVRGLSTLKGNREPLIILDNFPYDGDISGLNPNMIESVTILKDAAASSIWGARAANGVIVITTKSAALNQPSSIAVSAVTSVSPEPDLSYIPLISSADFIDLERELFGQGFYNSDLSSTSRPVISPVVDLLDKVKKGITTAEEAEKQISLWRSIDSRDQFAKYLYSPALKRQFGVDLASGAPRLSWRTFIGYDDLEGSLSETSSRLNLSLKNQWRPSDRISLSTALYFISTAARTGKPAFGSVAMKNGNALPYMQLADAEGKPLPVFTGYNENFKNSFGDRLLDWRYYPLTDWQHNTTDTGTSEVILSSGLNWKLFKGLEADLKYQYHRNQSVRELMFDEKSYYTRNLINTYTQLKADGTAVYPVPRGSIFHRGTAVGTVNNLRAQLNYNRDIGKNQLTALAGAELRETLRDSEGNRYFGFNERNLTMGNVSYDISYPMITGGSSFIVNNDGLSHTNHRFVSLFANAAYTYDRRYTLTASARRDASNLFGLKTNDQWNPFWSSGLAWNLSSEDFYGLSWLPQLKLRTSYGFSGNIDPGMAAVSTIVYTSSSSLYTGTPVARVDNFYNPHLRWETVGTLNTGIDFTTSNGRIAGTIEYYRKKGDNLFGQAPLDYTIGTTLLQWNVAGMKGSGLDLELRTLNIDRLLKWNSVLNFSRAKDEVTRYNLNSTVGRQFTTSTVNLSGVVGLPVYSVFAYKWAGLDPLTGDPRGYLDGEVSTDYGKIMGALTDVTELRFFGSAMPTTYGSFINTFAVRNLSLDVGLIYKLGYWFRRSSLNYGSLMRDWYGHSDYAMRWQQPGDELRTDVPSNTYKVNSNRDSFYTSSEVLVEKGDHIRLQYINLNYTLPASNLQGLPLKELKFQLNAANLGLLWAANDKGIDPDYNLGKNRTVDPATWSFGINAKF